MKAFSLGLLLLAASQCGAFGQMVYHMNTPYRDEDFLGWAGPGSASLQGQAFLKTRGGDVRTCAGNPVYLLPANAYTQEMTEAEDRGVSGIDADIRLRSLIRASRCDAQGNFAFTAVPAGLWYVVATVVWEVPHVPQPGEPPPAVALLLNILPLLADREGGELRQRMNLRPGQNEVLLTVGDLAGSRRQ
jgi:hypothetical protein